MLHFLVDYISLLESDFADLFYCTRAGRLVMQSRTRPLLEDFQLQPESADDMFDVCTAPAA